MKFIRIFLLVLIIIGAFSLVTEKLWVPQAVNAILKHEGFDPAPITVEAPTVPFSIGNYKENEPTAFGDAMVTFSTDHQDPSILRIQVTDASRNLSNTYAISGPDFGLLYMLKYMNGNIYVITCTGCPPEVVEGRYMENEYNDAWTRQLRVYGPQNLEGRTLVEGQNIGRYAVSDDEKYIAIEREYDDSSSADALILDGTGKEIKVYTTKQLGFKEDLEPEFWKGHVLYLTSSGVEESNDKLAVIDVDSSKIVTYSIPNVGLDGEFVWSPDAAKIAYTDKPFFGDADSYNEWASSTHNEVHLFIFDLASKTQATIGTSHAKAFNVKWLDDHTLQYDDPITGSAVTKNDF